MDDEPRLVLLEPGQQVVRADANQIIGAALLQERFIGTVQGFLSGVALVAVIWRLRR